MFPAAIAFTPKRLRLRVIKLVMVVLPFVPVTAIILPFQKSEAKSSSPKRAQPAFFASTNHLWSEGNPGLYTMRSCSFAV